jgi:hypothetical protein
MWKRWSRRPELNWRPADYESAALPTELRRLVLILNVAEKCVKKPESLSDKGEVTCSLRASGDYFQFSLPKSHA